MFFLKVHLIKMVREAGFRARKYRAKQQPEAIRQRFTDLHDTMVEQVAFKFSEITEVERKVKGIVETPPAGVTVYSIEIPFYLNVGRQIYKMCKTLTGDVLKAEVQLVLNKWASRGLNDTLLKEIARLFGIEIAVITPSPYPPA